MGDDWTWAASTIEEEDMIRSMKRTSWDDGETYLCFEETRLLSIGSVERTLTIKQKDNTVFIKITPELRGFIEDGVF